jgi:hypothetical protein
MYHLYVTKRNSTAKQIFFQKKKNMSNLITITGSTGIDQKSKIVETHMYYSFFNTAQHYAPTTPHILVHLHNTLSQNSFGVHCIRSIHFRFLFFLHLHHNLIQPFNTVRQHRLATNACAHSQQNTQHNNVSEMATTNNNAPMHPHVLMLKAIVSSSLTPNMTITFPRLFMWETMVLLANNGCTLRRTQPTKQHRSVGWGNKT